MNLLVRILVIIGSSASIGFGVWHFFVPKTWKWFSYIDANATELVAAVRAINAFFSLSLGNRSDSFCAKCASQATARRHIWWCRPDIEAFEQVE